MSVLCSLLQMALRAGRIVPGRCAWRLGRQLGAMVGDVPGRDQRRCRQFMQVAFPTWSPAQVRRAARGVFAHFGGMALETLATQHAWPTTTGRRVPVHGAARLRAFVRASREGGTGGVFASGHCGNWELMATVVGQALPLTVVGRRLRHAGVNEILHEFRTRHGNHQLHQDAGVLACLRALRQGRFLATLPDQAVPRLASVFVPWFGVPALTPLGPALLATMANAPVLPVYSLRHRNNWHLHCGPVLWPERDRSREEAAARLTWRIIAAQETIIRRHPTQWAWWHRRWKGPSRTWTSAPFVDASGSVRTVTPATLPPKPPAADV